MFAIPAASWKESLNPAQLEAVTCGDGPVLVIAGAGTGKTWTLACRVAHLIEQGVPPERILLLTFSRRAAREMLSRAGRLVDRQRHRARSGAARSTPSPTACCACTVARSASRRTSPCSTRPTWPT